MGAATVGRLNIKLTADTMSAVRDIKSPTAELANLETAADKAQASLSRVKPSDFGGKTGGDSSGDNQAASMADQIGASFTSALAPIGAILGKLQSQFNQVGGTITTLARRIDDSMKFPVFDAFLNKVKENAPNDFIKFAASAVQSVRKVQSIMQNFGDVAGKSLDKINGTSFVTPIAGATRLASAIGGPVVQNTKVAAAGVTSFGKSLLAAFGFIGVAYKLVSFFKQGITSAISLNETLSKTKEVFGSSSASIVAQADSMAKAFGMQKGPMLDGASAIGLLATGAGYSEEAAAKLSNRLVALAADSTSFQDVSLDVALEKITAGLRGQSEPLSTFGALLNETAVKQEALRLGLSRGKKELDERTKIVARASLIETKLVKTSGDLERTQGSAANQFRKAGGGLDNFATSMGTLLLPAVTSGITAFNELQSSIIEVVEKNSGPIQEFAAGVAEAFDTAGVIIRNFGTFWEITGLKAQEFAANAIPTIQTFGKNAITIFGWVASSAWKSFLDLGRGLIKFFVGLGENLWEVIKASLTGGDLSTIDWSPMLDGFKSTVDKFPELLTPNLISMQDEIGKLGMKLSDDEAARASKLSKFASKKAAKTEDVPGKEKELKFAGAFDFRSKESYSAIIQARGIGGGDKNDKVVENTKKTAEQGAIANGHLATMARAMERFATLPPVNPAELSF